MKIQAFLRTPLFRGRYGEDRSARLDATVVEVHGTAEARDGGLAVAVSSLYDERGKSVEPPFTSLFLPISKVDYYIILS